MGNPTEYVTPTSTVSLGAKPASGPYKAEFSYPESQYPLKLDVWPSVSEWEDGKKVEGSEKPNPLVGELINAQIEGSQVVVHYGAKPSKVINEKTGKPYTNRQAWGICSGVDCRHEHDYEPQIAERLGVSPPRPGGEPTAPVPSPISPAPQLNPGGESLIERRLAALELAIALDPSAVAAGAREVVYAGAEEIIEWANGRRAPAAEPKLAEVTNIAEAVGARSQPEPDEPPMSAYLDDEPF